jgi:phosphatidylinositol-3-phosphatase
VAISSEDDGSRNSHGDRCAGCGAALPASQRYCLECGARRGPLPAAIAKRIDALKKRGRSDGADTAGSRAAATALAAAAAKDGSAEKGVTAEQTEGAEKDEKWAFMPSPEIAAVAVMALLAAGVVLGSVTSPLAESAGVSPIVLELGGSGSSSEPSEPVTASAPESAAPEATASVAPEEPIAAPAEAPAAEPEASEPAPKPLPELPEEATLPEIKHVFLIVLDGHGYEEAFGKASTAPYLSQTLAGEGKLLANYYAVAPGGLANEIALLSGQGPTPQTAADCPEYTAIAPGTVSAEGQVEGQGCVYPATTETLPGQLTAAKLTWRAYVEDIANGAAAGQATTCRHPVLGGADPSPAPVPGDAFETWRNPFVYFAGLAESPDCAKDDVGLDRLAPDLKKAEKTPALSYIVPNACHDGSETPCAPEQPAGLPATEGFLKTVVPEIEASPAYTEEGGLIAITFDQAPQAGPAADSSSCCGAPEYPNLPPSPASTEPPAAGGVKPTGGGGRVGLLLISPYVAPGTVEEASYYNHFSLLRSIEELFGSEPLGYAAEPVLTGFESGTVYDASPEESSVSPKK